ncbi:hypothetical protein DDE83_006408 [Stemphylium lycopersici]|uniref:Inner kinetochore subunit AME1 domain-containing protein n=1 Tax=Stemphylium lycopersici TaxID=183478 RepID=A0A364MZ83_STELY|nr:hypothetical protein DDE83_006408 [Stemphylium lycopersici]
MAQHSGPEARRSSAAARPDALGKRKRGSPSAQPGADDAEQDELSPDREEVARSIEKSRRVVATISPIREEQDNGPDELSVLEDGTSIVRENVFAKSTVMKRTPPQVVAQPPPSPLLGSAVQETPTTGTNGRTPARSQRSTSRRSKSTDPVPTTPSLLPNGQPRTSSAPRSAPRVSSNLNTPAAAPVAEEGEDELSPQAAASTPRVVGSEPRPQQTPREETEMDVDELSPQVQPSPTQKWPTPPEFVQEPAQEKEAGVEEQAAAPQSGKRGRGRPRRVVGDNEEENVPAETPAKPAEPVKPPQVVADKDEDASEAAPANPPKRGRPRKEVVVGESETQATPVTRKPRQKKNKESVAEATDETVDELSPGHGKAATQPVKPARQGDTVELSSVHEESHEDEEPAQEEEAQPTPRPAPKRLSPKQVQPVKPSTEKPPRKRQKFMGPKQAISVMRIKGSTVRGITVADTTRTILEENIDHRLKRMADKLQTSQDSDRRKALRSEINLSITFKESLNEKLMDLQDANDVLSTNFQKAKLLRRANADLRKEILSLQNSRQEIAIEHDDIQTQYDAERAKVDAKNTLSDNMFAIEAAIKNGRAKARKEGREEEGPDIPLSMLLENKLSSAVYNVASEPGKSALGTGTGTPAKNILETLETMCVLTDSSFTDLRKKIVVRLFGPQIISKSKERSAKEAMKKDSMDVYDGRRRLAELDVDISTSMKDEKTRSISQTSFSPSSSCYKLVIRCGSGWLTARDYLNRFYLTHLAARNPGPNASSILKTANHTFSTRSQALGPQPAASDTVTIQPLFHPFLRLPQELQEMIWMTAAGLTKDYDLCPETRLRVHPKPIPSPISLSTLLRISPSITATMQPYILHRTAFHFGLTGTTNFLWQSGPVNRAHVQRLAFHFGRGALLHCARWLAPDEIFDLLQPPVQREMGGLPFFWRAQLRAMAKEVHLRELVIDLRAIRQADIAMVVRIMKEFFGSVERVSFVETDYLGATTVVAAGDERLKEVDSAFLTFSPATTASNSLETPLSPKQHQNIHDPNTVRMANDNNPIKSVTPSGLNPVTSADNDGCSTCQQFNTLYDAIQAADADWAVFENKRDSITKSFARENHKKARIEFDNWLMTVEASANPSPGERKTRLEDVVPEKQHAFGGSEEEQPGIKRRRSHSPSTQVSVPSGELSDSTSQQRDVTSLSFRPSPKRSRSTNSLPGRKRLKFSDTVEFHETYRPSEEYHRSSETYVRGRNAPPEGSEYMDTSGSGQTFLKFTQMKKVGAKWVELSEEELAKKNRSTRSATGQQKLEASEEVEPQETNGDAAAGSEQLGGEAPPDARAARLARRAKGTAAMSSAPTKNTSARNRSSRISRNGKEPSTDGALEGVQGPSELTALASSTSTEDETRLTTDEGLGTAKRVEVQEERPEQIASAAIEKASTAAMHGGQLHAGPPHDQPHPDTQRTKTAAYQEEVIQHDTEYVETESASVIASTHPNPERLGKPMCIGWEDASVTTAPDARRAASTMLALHPTSANSDGTAEFSKTADRQDLSCLSQAHHGASTENKDVSDMVCKTPERLRGEIAPPRPKANPTESALRQSSEAGEHPIEGFHAANWPSQRPHDPFPPPAITKTVIGLRDPDVFAAAVSPTQDMQDRAGVALGGRRGEMIDEAGEAASQKPA